jgi:hypothetical protein
MSRIERLLRFPTYLLKGLLLQDFHLQVGLPKLLDKQDLLLLLLFQSPLLTNLAESVMRAVSDGCSMTECND